MVPAPFVVVLDANVLFPFTLRDTLLRAAAADFYQLRWSAHILDEMTRNLVRTGTMTEDRSNRLRAIMEREFPEAQVIGYEHLVDAMPNDPKDRHVVAAAVKAGAQVIATANLKDFAELPEGVEAQCPDEFLCNLFDLDSRGPAPTRVQEGCTYGPAFLAKLAIDKCADATPIYRVEKAMRRAGIPISRSTMNDLVFVAADACEPLWRAALAEVRVDAHVQADETSVRTQTRKERSFVWTFLSRVHTVYVFSASRSGDTPKVVLGGTRGALTIDGYTGYNVVTDVQGRERAGCWSHARRHVFDALATAPEARAGLDIILDLFMVERDAASADIVGTEAHLELRRTRCAPILDRLAAWMKETSPLFEPKSPMGEALRYLNNQWTRLRVFLEDPLVPIHNNASEAALRIVSLMRRTRSSSDTRTQAAAS